MKRIGYIEDTAVPEKLIAINPQHTDHIIFAFGEIDIRCYVRPNLDNSNLTPEALLQRWIDRYIHRIKTLEVNGARIVIMSIVPPVSSEKLGFGGDEPLAGTDEERVLYTTIANRLLSQHCEEFGWMYLDVYSRYKNEHGMMEPSLSDHTVHIADTTMVRILLAEAHLI